MTVGQRIRDLRKFRKMTGVQLAARTGLNQSYLSKVERGVSGYSPEGLLSIAHALGTTPLKLLGGTGDATTMPGFPVPVLKAEDIGQRNQHIDGYLVCDLPKPDQLFAIVNRWRSMEPEFTDGDILIFRRGRAPRAGEYVASTTMQKGGPVKKFRDLGQTPDGVQLYAMVPLNNDYPTYRSTGDNCEIAGTLVRHIRDYPEQA